MGHAVVGHGAARSQFTSLCGGSVPKEKFVAGNSDQRPGGEEGSVAKGGFRTGDQEGIRYRVIVAHDNKALSLEAEIDVWLFLVEAINHH